MIRLTRKLLRYLLAALPLACTPVRSPDEAVAYEDCLAAVKAEREQVAERLCPPSVDWDTCPHKDAIMADYEAKQRACR